MDDKPKKRAMDAILEPFNPHADVDPQMRKTYEERNRPLLEVSEILNRITSTKR